MERRIEDKVKLYFDDLKKNIKDHIAGSYNNISNQDKSDILKYIYDFENISLSKEDFTKRKRSKSAVPLFLRCNAKRSCGEQCTRKKKQDSDFCGTHDKNRPHGVISKTEETKEIKKLEVFLEEINGISYYIDADNNVYKTADILKNIKNPSIIGRYSIDKNSMRKMIISN